MNVIERKQTDFGNYRIIREGKKFSVVRQSAYAWMYVAGGKKVSESTAREVFQVVTL